MKLLGTSNLMVFYENALAINNVSLQVERGEIVAVLGSNGAGKSTLMYTIAGIILDQKLKQERRGGERITILGEIELWGENITALKARARVQRGIVLCPERRRVFGESTVQENLRIGAHRTRRAEEKEMLDAVWDLFPALWPLRKRRAGFLSGGEQQMLAIGRALMAKPELFLLDEPLLGLAPSVQVKVVEAIERIGQRGVTVLVAEQYARPILPVVQRGYVIESGSITLFGTGAELSENRHVRAAYFGV